MNADYQIYHGVMLPLVEANHDLAGSGAGERSPKWLWSLRVPLRMTLLSRTMVGTPRFFLTTSTGHTAVSRPGEALESRKRWLFLITDLGLKGSGIRWPIPELRGRIGEDMWVIRSLFGGRAAVVRYAAAHAIHRRKTNRPRISSGSYLTAAADSTATSDLGRLGSSRLSVVVAEATAI